MICHDDVSPLAPEQGLHGLEIENVNFLPGASVDEELPHSQFPGLVATDNGEESMADE